MSEVKKGVKQQRIRTAAALTCGDANTNSLWQYDAASSTSPASRAAIHPATAAIAGSASSHGGFVDARLAKPQMASSAQNPGRDSWLPIDRCFSRCFNRCFTLDGSRCACDESNFFGRSRRAGRA